MLAWIKKTCAPTSALAKKLAWLGPFLVRLTLGIVFARTGWGKLHDLDRVEAFFASLHIPAPGFHAAFVSTVELVCGVLLIIGWSWRVRDPHRSIGSCASG